MKALPSIYQNELGTDLILIGPQNWLIFYEFTLYLSVQMLKVQFMTLIILLSQYFCMDQKFGDTLTHSR
jgi:hypothetical protein